MSLQLSEFLSFWKGRRVLVTGHSGFKGSWLTIWLHHLGAKVSGISLAPSITPNLFSLCHLQELCNSHFADIRDSDALSNLMGKCDPEIIFHLAAQPLVRKSYLDPLTTFDTNVMGTANLLNGMRKLPSLKSSVIITTDKVYENLEHSRPYIESDKLGGYDPYSASKAASEIVISSYFRSFLREDGVSVSSARAGNILGGGDWSEDRLLPDAIRAWQKNETLKIRHPKSVRPWQHVLEPLYGYMLLARAQWENPNLAGAYNFGPAQDKVYTVKDVVLAAHSYYGSGEVQFGDEQDSNMHEAGLLLLDVEKSRSVLNFKPFWNLDKSIQKSIKWHQSFLNNQDARSLCLADIIDYEKVIGIL